MFKGTAYDFMGMTRARMKRRTAYNDQILQRTIHGTVRRYTAKKYGGILVKKFDPAASDVSFYGAKADAAIRQLYG